MKYGITIAVGMCLALTACATQTTQTVAPRIDRFGALSPSAVANSREYIWPEGKMPHAQKGQIAAKTEDANAPGFKRSAWQRPYVDWYEPAASERKGVCVITVSGGGFECCCDARRLQPAIDRFVKMGVTVANLTYRTPRPEGLPTHQSAWEDLQRAVRVVRSQAKDRGFDPEHIGALGISAGSKAILMVATSSKTAAYEPIDAVDKVPCHLNFALPICPAYVLTDGETGPNSRGGDSVDVKLVKELAFDDKTCPICIFQGGKDQYSPCGSTQIYRQLRRMRVPAELHLYPDREHDVLGNLNKTESPSGHDRWFVRAQEFMTQIGIFGKPAAEVSLESRFPDDSARAGYEKQLIWPADKMPDVQTNQCTPYIEWHSPKVLKTKAIQIIYSGGSYTGGGPESFEVTPARRYLNEQGMTVVTMKYRTPRPLNGLSKHTTAWQDLQRAIRLVRSQAKERGLDPDRIGIMGSSAGGHLTLMGATSSKSRSYLDIDAVDKISCKVQWAVAIYPAYGLTDGLEECNKNCGTEDDAVLAPEFAFDCDTCPILFIHGDVDGWAAMNSVKAWEQLRRMGLQGELHTLAKRSHCFQRNASPGTGSYTWHERIWEFMNQKGFNR